MYDIISPVSVYGKLRTADCGPGIKCRLSVKWRLQSRLRVLNTLGAKWRMRTADWGFCRPSVNCRLGRVKRQKSTANTCKRSLTWHLLSQIHFFLLWNVIHDPKSWTFFPSGKTGLAVPWRAGGLGEIFAPAIEPATSKKSKWRTKKAWETRTARTRKRRQSQNRGVNQNPTGENHRIY